ncbi:Clavata3/ESR (CLE) gene family member MtCLE08 [Medicago truncatula]|nr:Clavata3/ESR (CLE) gene family member MtCLE08 [Medicago truncatula]
MITGNKFPVSQSRKMLATGFDFTPFINRHRHSRLHHRHQDHHYRSHTRMAHPNEPKKSEIDPLYGVDKRLVPTGPNPLHH